MNIEIRFDYKEIFIVPAVAIFFLNMDKKIGIAFIFLKIIIRF